MNAVTQAYINEHAADDVCALALRPVPQGVDLRWALQQIEGRQLAARKLPTWAATEGLWWPPRLSLEQCSSEATARYKARLAAAQGRGVRFYDLTGGLGVDFSMIAAFFDEAVHVETNATLSELVAHNLPLLGIRHARTICADAETVAVEMAGADLVMLDPARRDSSGRKTVRIADCTPDVCTLLPLLLPKVRAVLLKLSPMLDVTAALRDIPQTKEVHVVSVDGECKELLLTVTGGEASTPTMHAVMLSASACDGQPVSLLSFTSEEEREAAVTYADSIGAWLYEPDAAVLKAGAVRLAGVRFGIDKLAPMSHLYTSDRYLPDWPGKSFKVERVFTFSRSDLRALKASTPRADLSTRGFPQAVAQLRARLGLKEGGDAHLFATTLADGRKVIIKT